MLSLDQELQLTFGFTPVQKQVDIWNAIHDPQWTEVVVDAGRAFGKDLVVGAALLQLCVQKPGSRILFITPFYSQIESFWEQVMEGINDDTGEFWVPQLFFINQNKRQIRFFNGSVIICMSAENAKAIRSKRANLIVVNEAAFIEESIINRELRATRKKNKNSKIVYISTPNGKNWFWKKFVQGLRDPNHENYTPGAIREKVISFHATYIDNPLSSLDVEDMRNNLPIKIFEQEVLARFLDDSSVFTYLEKAFFEVGELDAYVSKWVGEAPIKARKENGVDLPAARYVMGIDWAKTVDWTVFTIMNQETGKVVYWERLQKMDWNSQAMNAMAVAHEYNDAPIIYDATGVGAAAGDSLANVRLKKEYSAIEIFPEVFNNQFKQDIIQSLALRIERPNEFQCFIPNIPQLLHEMRVLQSGRTKMGQLTYDAPEGEHDDCVFSLALCNYLWNDLTSMPALSTTRLF